MHMAEGAPEVPSSRLTICPAPRRPMRPGGGASYGLSIPALVTLRRYMRSEYPRFLSHVDNCAAVATLPDETAAPK